MESALVRDANKCLFSLRRIPISFLLLSVKNSAFFFTSGVVLLFMTLFFVGVLQLKRAPNLYQYLIVMGALLFITFQALINIGVVTGCLPTKGDVAAVHFLRRL